MKRPLLAPLTPLYAAGVACRNMRLARGWEEVQRLGLPVVSVGNLSTGGSGKTPLVIALARLLEKQGVAVDVLSRGYGREGLKPTRVRKDGGAAEFGDEPLMLARELDLPIYVAAERYDAGLLAEGNLDAGKGRAIQSGELLAAHLLDDGFQHRQLARDVDILLLNRDDWHDALLPAGNLREPRTAAMRASAIVIPADEPELVAELRAWGWQGPIWRLRRRMLIPPVEGPAAAFCGIARPGQFFDGLSQAGINVAVRTHFRDHHRYTTQDIQGLLAAARAAGATSMVTTEKDLVRLGDLAVLFPDLPPNAMPLKPVRLAVEFDDEAAIVSWLIDRLKAAQKRPAKAKAAL